MYCVEHCPEGYATGKGGICELENDSHWYLIHERTAFPREYTLRFEATNPAGVLLDAGDLIIADNYIIYKGIEHTFADANCIYDECFYTISVSQNTLNYYINEHLVGSVELEEPRRANLNNKIIGDQVVDAKMFWGYAHEPLVERPARRLQTG